MNSNRLDKTILKRLIKEVLNELDDMAVEPKDSDKEPKGSDDNVMSNTIAAKNLKNDKATRDTVITLRIKGMHAGAPTLEEFLKQAAYAAKMKDLELIHAEIEKSGKTVASMDKDDLMQGIKDKFNTSDTKSVNRKTSKEKPPIQGDENDWKNLTDKDMATTNARMRQKDASIKAGTFDPEDTQHWSDEDWKNWELLQRSKDPARWDKFDRADRTRV